MTNIIKYLLFILTLCFCHYISLAQQSKIDSLLTLLKTDKPDTSKVIHFYQLTREYEMTGDYEKGLNIGTEALELAHKLNFKKGIAQASNNIGNIYLGQADYTSAIDYYLKALKLDEELKNKNGIAKRLGNIGLVYKYQGDFPKALNYYFKALKMAEEIGDKKGIAICLGNIGTVYYHQGAYSSSLDYNFKALKMSEELEDKNRIALWFSNIGIVYGEQAMRSGNQVTKDSLYKKALYYFFKALKVGEELGNKDGIAMCLGNIGSLYTSQKRYSEAEKYLLKALEADKEIRAMDYERHTEEAMADLYFETKRFQLALQHYKKAVALKDTIFSQENKKQLVRKEMNYEFGKKEAANKAEQEKKDAITEADSKKQKIIISSVAIGLLLVMIFAGFIFRSLRITRKQKQIIEVKSKETEEQKKIVDEKNKLVEEKQKEILDSITYAKRIQSAMLPHRRDIWAAFPNSFVLFKPKDIVSGDFYFFHKSNKSVFIAAADCTGHGVPGAFMSMIGSERLTDAVQESSNTSEILSLLNNGIKTSLKQSENENSTRDGMDIALCSVDTDKHIVKYAGANRPIWIIRNGQTEVEEIKATKKAIGGFTDDSQHFDTHEIKLQQGDTFYIFTDGYADQFGGKDKKKLMTKKFKEILLEIQDKPMKEQGQHLDNIIENWKAGTEQVDDILVIGVQL
ncbi:MAG: tetratricopeptide repeat protein [Bacteroidetes bacterium]|nr:tetratricopeptide repeat protein [Bacteroidota bacterium]